MRRFTLVLVICFLLSLLVCSFTWAAAPRPPRDLVAVDPIGDQGNSIKLVWRKSLDDGAGANNVTSYKVWQRQGTNPFVQVGTVTATGNASYVTKVLGLTREQAYDFGVTANGAEASTMLTVSATPHDTRAPGPVVNLRAVDPVGDNGSLIKLIFARSADDGVGAKDVVQYKIYKRLASETTLVLTKRIYATGAASYVVAVSGLTKDQAYTFGVRATDGINDSVMMTCNGTPTDTAPPRPARDLKAVDVADDNGSQIKVVFSKSLDDGGGQKDVQSYAVWKKRGTEPFSQVGTVTATGAATYSLKVTGLTRNLTYTFGVTCTDGRNTSTMATTTGKPLDNLAPQAPTSVQLTDVAGDDGNALQLTFHRSLDDGTGAKDVGLYHLFRRTADSAWQEIGTIPATGAYTYTQTLTGLNAGISYGVGVTADDGIYQSEKGIGWGTPVDNTVPQPPTNVVVTDAPNDAGTALLVTFNASVDDTATDREVLRYRLYRSVVVGGLGVDIGQVSATGAASYQYKDTGLTRGTAYYYRLRAEAATGNSPYTSQVGGIPVDDRPVAAPSNLTAVDAPYDNGGVINLTWSKSADDGGGTGRVNRYFIYRRMANVTSDPDKIATVTATGAATYAYADSTVAADLILYDYTVTAVTTTDAESAPAGPARASSEDNNAVVFDPPTGLTVADVPADTGGQLRLTWYRSPSENEIGPPPPPPFLSAQGGYGGQYDFYRRTASGSYTATPTFVVSADGTTNPMAYTDTGLTNGTRYYYKVRYRRYNQISDFTAEASAIPLVGGGNPAAAGAAAASAEVAAAVAAAGADLEVPVTVRATGASTVALEWSVTGEAAQFTASQSGSGEYQVSFRLPTASLTPGTVVTVRVVLRVGDETLRGAPRTITVN